MIKISVTIATRNRAEALRTISLPSLARQNFKDFEVIVWDASNDDDTKTVCEEFKNNNPSITVRYFKAPRVGSAFQRNDAVKVAKGEIIFFIDDDSEVSNDGLESLKNEFELDPNVMGVGLMIKNPEVIYSFGERLKNFLRDLYSKLFKLTHRSGKSRRVFLSGWNLTPTVEYFGTAQWLSGGSMAFRREVFNEFTFEEELQKFGGYALGEDVQFSHRLSQEGMKLVIARNGYVIHHATIGGRIENESRRVSAIIYNHYLIWKTSVYPYNRISVVVYLYSFLGEAIFFMITGLFARKMDRIYGLKAGIKEILGYRRNKVQLKRDKIKICYLIGTFSRGGAENIAYSLAFSLSDRYQIFIVALKTKRTKESKDIISELEKQGVKTFQISDQPRKKPIYTILKLTKILRNEKIDILHTHTLFYGRIAGWLSGVPIRIVTFHGTVWSDKKRYLLERFLVPFTSQYVTVSDDTAEFFGNIFGKRKPPIVIPNGVDIRKFQHVKIEKGSKRQTLGLLSTDIVLINVARIDPVKGQKYLIYAMHSLSKRYLNLRLLIAGGIYDSDFFTTLNTLVKELQLCEKIKFLGSRTDVAELLSISDIFVFPSLKESLGIALLEAMAAGLPIIASNITNIRKIINHGTEGLLVPPKDPNALANSISKIIEDHNYGKHLGQSAKRKVESFSIDETINAYEKLYKQSYAKKIK